MRVPTLLSTLFAISSLILVSVNADDSTRVTIPVDSDGNRWSHIQLPAAASTKHRRSSDRGGLRAKALTNAQLLSRGFNPRSPAKFEAVSKKRAPTRVYHRAPATSSNLPLPTVGNIVVTSANGVLGYVSNVIGQWGTAIIAPDLGSAGVFTRPDGQTSNFNLQVAGGEYPFLGAVRSPDPAPGAAPPPLYAFLSQTDDASAPAEDTNNPIGLGGESNIWSITPTGQLTAVWVDDNLVSHSMTLFHDLTYDDLDMTVDPTAFDTYFQSEEVEVVTFTFVATT